MIDIRQIFKYLEATLSPTSLSTKFIFVLFLTIFGGSSDCNIGNRL